MIYLTLPAVVLGFFIDLLIGDPRWMYHPVCVIGNGISAGEKLLRKIFPGTRAGERAAGCVLAVTVLVLAVAVPAVILLLLYHISWIAGFIVETFFCYQLLATKSLKQESKKVYTELKEGTLTSARKAVSMIVGRDTAALDEKGITKAAVETVAENASDGVIAPLFYMMIGGAVWGFAYKAINTMDSMLGYKNEKYRYFGTAAARLDDAVNYIPARISGLLMILASFLCGMNGKNAWTVYKRDRKKHASPNAAQTEAVMAGALDIQLAGDAWYFGTLHKKPFIGDCNRMVEPEDIPRSHRILYATAVLALAVFAVIRCLLMWVLCIL